MMDEEKVILCRCEDITLARLRQCLESGVTELEEIKRLLRCGMGLCQGRTCIPMVMREIARFRGSGIDEIIIPKIRQPIQPVKFSSILEGIDEE